MFKKIISDLLTKFLGDYVELNAETFNFAVWSGSVELRNLKIKKEALRKFNVPFDIKGGVLGSLEIKIPWRNISQEPVVLIVSDISVIIGPRKEVAWTLEDEQKELESQKISKLNKLEKQKLEKRMKEIEGEKDKDTFASKLAAKIIESVQIYLSNIHIRYEDDRDPKHPFSLGITLDNGFAKTTDFEDEIDENIIHKLVTLQNLAIYWNDTDPPISYRSDEELVQKMTRLIYKDNSVPNKNKYIGGPICGSLKITLLRNLSSKDETIPKVTLSFIFETIQLKLSENQLVQLIKLLEWNLQHKQRQRLAILKPKIAIKQDPLSWWKFSLNNATRDYREKKKRFCLDALTLRRQRRLEYIKLWTKFIKDKTVSPRLKELEHILTFEDISYFRYLAEAKFTPQQLVQGKKSSWFSWYYGGSALVEKNDDELSLLTPEQQEFFLKSIGYSESEEKSVVSHSDSNYDFVKMKVGLILEKIVITLEGTENGKCVTLAEASATQFKLGALVRKASFSISASLEKIKLEDHYTHKSCFPVLIQSYQIAGSPTPDHFFTMQFDVNPPSSEKEFDINMRIEGIDIVINLPWILRIVKMFKKPWQENSSKRLEKEVEKQVTSIKNLSYIQVKHLVETRKTFGVNITACAPRLILPEDAKDKETSLIVVDLGDLLITSQGHTNIEFTEDSRWQDHLYDQYLLNLTGLQVLLMNFKSWKKEKYQNDHKEDMTVVEKFDVNISLGILMIPETDQLSKIRLSGFLPRLIFKFSGYKIRDLLRVLITLGDDDPPDPLPQLVPLYEIEEPALDIPLPDEIVDFDAPVSSIYNKKLECHFSIGEVFLHLSRNEDNGTEKPIIFGILDGLVVQYVLRVKDMVAYVGVHSITMEDLLQSNGEKFRYLATSSRPNNLQPVPETDEDLIKIAYERVKASSPNFQNIENQVDLSFSSLYVNFNRQTILVVLDILKTAFLSDRERRYQRRLKRLKEWGMHPDQKKDKKKEKIVIEDSNINIIEDKSQDEAEPSKASVVKKEPPKNVLIKLTATLKTIGFSIIKDEEIYAFISLTNTSVQYQMHDSITDIKGSLGGVRIEDLSPHANYYPQIMAPLQKESLIQFTYREYNPNFADYPGYKDKLRMKVNSINFILVQRFLFDIAKIFTEMSSMKIPGANNNNIVDNSSSESSEVKEPSAQNEQTPAELHQQRSRFEIMIVNLKLLVPKNSISPEFVQLDMGTISLFNTHFIINEEEQLYGERMSFCMHEANCTVGSALDPGKFHTIIDNLNMIFEFERAKGDNPKNAKIPFKFTGEVDHLRARVTERQYALFINTIRQNVSERSLRANRDNPPSDSNNSNNASQNNNNNDKKEINAVKESAIEEIFTTLALGINIHKLSMELLREDPDDVDLLHSYAYGEMENFMYTLVNTSDSTTRMDFSWDTITVLDTRPTSENKFTKLWGDEDDIKRTEPQFRFFWTSDYLSRKKLSIKLNKIRMVMVPLVYTIKGFFTTNYMSGELPIEITECFPNAPPPPIVQNVSQSELIDLDEVDADFVLNLIVSELVVKFPENWEDENSRGVIASSDFLMKIASHQGQTGFHGFVENLQINNCILRKESDTMVRILKPMNVSFNSNSCPRESNVSIILEPITVAFSYRDFKVLMAIAKCLTPPTIEAPSLSSSQHTEIVSNQQPVIQQQNLSLTTGGLKLTIIDDLKGHNVPLLNFKMYGISAAVDNWSSALFATFNFKLQSDYYNVEIAHWEPLIEPWSCSVKTVKTPILDTNPTTYDSKVSVTSQDILNINISKTFFNTFKSSVSSWTDDYNNNLNVTTSYLDYSIMIRNCTGLPVSYWVDPEIIYQLQDGQEEPLATIEQHVLSDREAEIDELANKSITIQIAGGWDALEHLPVNRIGSWVISLTPKPNNGDTRIVYSIEYKDGYKLITIRSNVMVVNSCNIPIDICIDVPHKERVILNPIPADSTCFIPIQFALVGVIRVKPSNMPEYDFCSPHIPCSPNDSSTISIQCENSLNAGGFGSSWYFSGSIDIRKVNQKGRHVISISAPLRIDNLLAEDVAVSIYRVGGQSEIWSSMLKRGDSLHLYSIPHRKMAEISIHFPDKFGKSKRECLDSNLVQARLYDFKNRELILFIENSCNEEGTNVSSIYAKYWLVNKLGLPMLFMQKSKIGSEKEPAAGLAEVEKLYEVIGPNMQYTSLYSDFSNNTTLSTPLMYSYSDLDIFGNKTSIKIANSKWSKPISLESVGTNGSVSVSDTDSKLNYHVGVEIELLSGRFHRTKKITFRPRYVLVNKLDRTLFYKQKDTKARYILEAGKELPFHWFDKDQTPELSITFSDTHNWSTPFSISEITEFAIKISKEGEAKLAECYLARIEIQLHNSTLFVLFKPEARDVPPYRIENCTNEEIIFFQKGSNIRENLQPMLKEGYTWDLPGGSHKLIITIPALQNYKQEFNLDKIRTYDIVEITIGKEKAMIRGRTFIDGPTRVLRITDLCRMEDGETGTYDSNLPSFHFEVEIAGAGISMIDNTPQELLYISLTNILYDFGSSISEQIHEFRIKEFQIDNQMLSTSFPVLLSIAPQEEDSYFFHLGIVKSNFFTTIDYFHYFSFLMQEIHFKADDMILNHLLSFVQVSYGVEPNFEDDFCEQIIVPKPSAKKLYIELLKLSPIKCYLTFNYSSSDHKKVIDEEHQNPVKTVLNAIGVTVANIEDAPIYLNSLNINHAFHTREEMITSITKHYYFQLLSEVYKVVFSFDIIGNPVSLVHNLGTGVYDFFYEPAKGFVKSPKEFVIGVRKGSTSLVKNSVAGIFNTASKITGSLSKGVAHLAFDKEYVRQREKNNREKAKHVTQGISLGAKELGTGLFKGITGVVTAPISGAKREGVGGMIKGLGKGVIGAAVKPGVGIFDMCTRTTEGIKNFVTISDNIELRVRPPRGFGPDKVLFPYDREKAIGQSILRSLDQSSFEDHWHLFHCISLQDNLVLVSNKKVFYINVGEQDIQWSCDITDIESVKAEITHSNKIRIKHKSQATNWPIRTNMKSPELIVRVIEFAHPDTAKWLENKLRTTKNIISRFERDEDDLAFSV